MLEPLIETRWPRKSYCKVFNYGARKEQIKSKANRPLAGTTHQAACRARRTSEAPPRSGRPSGPANPPLPSTVGASRPPNPATSPGRPVQRLRPQKSPGMLSMSSLDSSHCADLPGPDESSVTQVRAELSSSRRQICLTPSPAPF